MSFIAKLFAVQPGSAFNYYFEMIVFIALLAIASIVFNFVYRKRKNDDKAFKKLFKNTSSGLGWFAFTLALLLMFRTENIAYFSMRIWLYITVLWAAYFSAKSIYTFLKVYPTEAQKEAAKPKKDQKAQRYSTKKS